jgi:hypothetical protein
MHGPCAEKTEASTHDGIIEDASSPLLTLQHDSVVRLDTVWRIDQKTIRRMASGEMVTGLI